MNEARFWSMIEDAWHGIEGAARLRTRLVKGPDAGEAAEELSTLAAHEFVPALRVALGRLPREELMEFDRILERKLYDIDRAEIQRHADGSDDGFLYARGFIVAAGKAYYDAVNKDPSRAATDAECEDLCYLSLHVYEERFGELPHSDISRETGSNNAGWPEGE